MKKSIIYSLIIIVIIILGIVVGVNLTKDDETSPTNSNKTENNVTENKVENNVENVIENKVEDNTNVENIVEEEPIASGEKDVSANPKTDLERAIEIVKKDWGEDSTVYFAQDGQTANGEYIICVRDNNTTSALAWYTVDVADETFVKE